MAKLEALAPLRRGGLAVLVALAAALHAAPAQAAEVAPLRVCLDPDNLPFSSSQPNATGFYVDVAHHIAAALGRSFEPVWTLSYFGKRSVRTTLLDRKCDAYIGLPDTADFMGPRLLDSHPILPLGYVLALPSTREVTKLADLHGLRVAVQFGSPPQSLIATDSEIETVTVRETADGMQALADGKADVAFIWGPTAGFVNKTRLHDRYRILPVAGAGMQWRAAIGFPRDQAALRDQVDAVIDASAGAFAALRAKYGFPAAADGSITLAQAASTVEHAAAALAAEPSTPVHLADAPPAAPAMDGIEPAAEGHALFNVNCSHCHGPDAVQAQRNIDLRRLRIRHGERLQEVFDYTVHHGRAEKGMPNWDGVLSEAELGKIKAFLIGIQS